jgi:hypothetical protein
MFLCRTGPEGIAAGRDGGEGLSVADAVALVAVQLGLEAPVPEGA